MKGDNWGMNIQELVKNSELVLEQVRKEYAENGIPMVTFDKDLCNSNEVLLVFPDGNCENQKL